MTDTDHILIETAATVDAIFTPHRRYTLSADTDQLHAQARYHDKGLPMPTTGTAADRKREERQRRAMQAAGLIELRHKGNRAVAVKLNVKGYFYATALAGTGSLAGTMAVLRRLAKLIETGHGWTANDGTRYVEELELAGLKAYDRAGKWRAKVSSNEDALRFANAAGWVSDCVGMTPVDGSHDWTLTPLGIEIVTKPPAIGKLPRFNREAADYYAEVFESNQFPVGMPLADARAFNGEETETTNKTGSISAGKE